MTVWDAVVGQPAVVDELRQAAADAAAVATGSATGRGAMTHAWLFTGPAGSGRSVAARAFAAALQCQTGGCGTCPDCRTVLGGTHADVRFVVPSGLSIGVDAARELVLQAAGAPSGGRWRIVLIEDADRLTESASNALLKAIEEPPERGVFLLCAPSTHPDDVSVTVRSRCRVVPLRVPPAAAVAAVLVQQGVDPVLAAWAARAAQGHVGRARRLAVDEQARGRRKAVLGVPGSLRGLAACFAAAEELIAAAEEEAAALTETLDGIETEELKVALGAGGTGKRTALATRGTAGQLKELDRTQRSRRTRAQRDALDRALVDLAAFYRDVLVARLGAAVAPVHADLPDVVGRAARAWSPESVLRRLEAILACRQAIELNVKPLIAVEAMAVSLLEG
jgi:DNA polymerase-3 subunit delta'